MHCAGCQAPILDRYLLNVLDRAWHIRCVQCADCGSALTDKCFSRDGKLYCRTDFFRRYGTKCAGCSQGISPNDLVRKAQNKVFHLRCFTCMICRKQLSTGEELYIVGENKFLCKEDYLQNKFDGSDVEDDGMDFDSTLDSQECISDKDLFGDDKSHIGIKSDIKTTDGGIKSEVLLNSNHSLNGSNPLNDKYDSKLSSECPSPIKMEPMHHPSDQISLKAEYGGLCDTLPTSPTSPDVNMNCSTTSGPGSDESLDINDNVSCGDINDNEDPNDQDGKHSGPGSKRRGPRTTIKAKQLEILKAAFNATPKPTRHIREQLASETGLNMRVIQVWFQNRRSKERRMKQLSALGARRHFYRTPRRMRALRGELDEAEMMGPGYGYFNDSEPDMYGNFPPYNNFYPGQTPDMTGTMNYMMPPNHRGTPPHMDQGMMTSRVGMPPDGHYMPGDILPPSSSPDCIPPHSEENFLSNGPGRPLGPPFSSLQPLQTRREMTSEVW